jgi:hypothetical protein
MSTLEQKRIELERQLADTQRQIEEAKAPEAKALADFVRAVQARLKDHSLHGTNITEVAMVVRAVLLEKGLWSDTANTATLRPPGQG